MSDQGSINIDNGGGSITTLFLSNKPMYYNVVHAHITVLTSVIQAFSILNIPLGLIVIGMVIYFSRHHDLKERVSFRLSASIALADIIYAIVQLIVNTESLTDNMSEIQLRALFFVHLTAFNATVFISGCISHFLHCNALLNKKRFARKCSPWYEAIAWGLALAISQAMFYVYDRCLKFKGLNIIIMAEDSLPKMRATIWAMYGWCALTLLYCLYVCIMVVIRLMPVWKRISSAPVLSSNDKFNSATHLAAGEFADPEPIAHPVRTNRLNSANSEMVRVPISGQTHYTSEKLLGTKGKRSEASERRRREIRFAVIRIAMYCLQPIITTCIMPIYLSILNPSIALANVTILLPNLGGTLNFIIFMVNPQLDPMWQAVAVKLKLGWTSCRSFVGLGQHSSKCPRAGHGGNNCGGNNWRFSNQGAVAAEPPSSCRSRSASSNRRGAQANKWYSVNFNTNPEDDTLGSQSLDSEGTSLHHSDKPMATGDEKHFAQTLAASRDTSAPASDFNHSEESEYCSPANEQRSKDHSSISISDDTIMTTIELPTGDAVYDYHYNSEANLYGTYAPATTILHNPQATVSCVSVDRQEDLDSTTNVDSHHPRHQNSSQRRLI